MRGPIKALAAIAPQGPFAQTPRHSPPKVHLVYFRGSALTLGFSTDDDDAKSYWAHASKLYVASARKRASLHIVSGPSADEGCDAPLQQRDVSVRTFSSLLHRTKRWKDICAVWGLLISGPLKGGLP